MMARALRMQKCGSYRNFLDIFTQRGYKYGPHPVGRSAAGKAGVSITFLSQAVAIAMMTRVGRNSNVGGAPCWHG